MDAVLTIHRDGTVSGLYTEAIPLQELGTLAVNRITEIEFDPAGQCWEARDHNGAVLHSNPSRQACLDWEHERFNR